MATPRLEILQIDFDLDLLRLDIKVPCAAAKGLAEVSASSYDKESVQELPCKASTDVVIQ